MKLCKFLPFVTSGLALLAPLPATAQSWNNQGRWSDPEIRNTTTPQTGPSGIMSTVAGNGDYGYGPMGGPATATSIYAPQGVAVDKAGNLYISAPWLAVVYKVTASTGNIALYAGTGEGGFSGQGGLATAARLGTPYGLALNAAGDLFIADERDNVVWKVAAPVAPATSGTLSVVAGNGVGAGIGGNNNCGIPSDGVPATSSSLCFPTAVAVDGSGNLFIADYQDNEIRKVTAATGLITTVAGPRAGYRGDGQLAVNASLRYPVGVAVDTAGNVYIADTSNCAVRKITVATGVISSLVGTPNAAGTRGNCGLSDDGTAAATAMVGRPHAVAVDGSGNVFFSDSDYSVVHLIDAAGQKLYTVAGINFPPANPYSGIYPEITAAPGPARYEFLDDASGLTVDTNASSPTFGDVLLADAGDNLVYKIGQAALTPASAPTITPAFATAAAPTQITMTAPVAGSTIYYTTNGSVPTTSSTKYGAAPFTLSKSAVITAFATVPGQANSQATIDTFLDAPTPQILPASAPVAGATTITITDTTTGGKIYYTTDGSDPTAGGPTVKTYSSGFSVTPTSAVPAVVQAAYFTAVTDFAGNPWSAWSPIATSTYTLASKPAVTTAAATSVTATTATLNGTVNPEGAATQSWFLWGTTNPPTTLTAKVARTGSAAIPVTANLTGLVAGKKYYFQAVASDVAGTTTSAAVLNFTTP
ncbi:MAG: FN3 associated domain-containing protein [Terracidiphilus sp.]